MINANHYNPIKFIFGKDAELEVGEQISKYSHNIMVIYYGKAPGKLVDRISNSLGAFQVKYSNHFGVKPNPRADLVYSLINICREKNIDMVLAVGGGSVIDTAKAVAVGVPYSGDFFGFYVKGIKPKQALNIGVILTTAGSGSETSNASVIVNGVKRTFINDVLFPRFSILNPELTYSVPYHISMYGIIDGITHALERYYSRTDYTMLTSGLCESVVSTLIHYGKQIKNNLTDYNIRAEIMWACKLAHDNSCGFGRKQDWSCHTISHEIGGIYDFSHGAILGVLFPAWMKYVGVADDFNFIEFLENENVPHTLRALGIPDDSRFEEIAVRSCAIYPSGTIGNYKRLDVNDVIRLLQAAY